MSKSASTYDVIVIGAGGAGMMCAAVAGKRGKKVLVLDHSTKLGRKILISGGGRCNFTNIHAGPHAYYCENPHFVKSALARYRPEDFLTLIEKHQVPYYEKKLGQLFCRDTAQRIVELLRRECMEANAEIRLGALVESVEKHAAGFLIHTKDGDLSCEKLVIATGGLSVPQIGASDFGHKVARQFGHKITRLVPALISLTMDKEFQQTFSDAAGLSVDAEVSCGGRSFRENILITHAGLSGPAILQASLFWNEGEPLSIDLSPDFPMDEFLQEKKKSGSRATLRTVLSERFAKNFAERFCEYVKKDFAPATFERAVAELSDALLKEVSAKIHGWKLVPTVTGGYGKAEATRGGVDTDELSSKTLESKLMPGLYFIGEVVDVTGMLGGYNFHWAWASGTAAGNAV